MSYLSAYQAFKKHPINPPTLKRVSLRQISRWHLSLYQDAYIREVRVFLEIFSSDLKVVEANTKSCAYNYGLSMEAREEILTSHR